MSVKELSDKLRKRGQRRLHVTQNPLRHAGEAEDDRLQVEPATFTSRSSTTLRALRWLRRASLEESLKGFKRNVEGAAKLGEEIGKRLKEKNVSAVVFDRNGYKYHGIVKAIADGARKAGIAF